jgi:hypothetical protein
MKETTLTLEQIETIITGYPDAPYFISGRAIAIQAVTARPLFR